MNLRLLLSVVLVSFLVSARGQEVAVLSADSSAVDSLIVEKEPLISDSDSLVTDSLVADSVEVGEPVLTASTDSVEQVVTDTILVDQEPVVFSFEHNLPAQALLRSWRSNYPFKQPDNESILSAAVDKAGPSALLQAVDTVAYDSTLSYAQNDLRLPIIMDGSIPEVAMPSVYDELQPSAENALGLTFKNPYQEQLAFGSLLHQAIHNYSSHHLGRVSMFRHEEIDLPFERKRIQRQKVEAGEQVETEMGLQLQDASLNIDQVTFHADKWHRTGSTDFQMSQTALSDNWYKGGDNNMTLATYDKLAFSRYDESKITSLDITLELRLSGYYTKADTVHSMRVSDNAFRADVSYGYKAWKNWYYSTSAYVKTPILEYYNANSKTVKNTFLSPLELNVSVGMDLKLTSNKKCTYSLLLAPLSYNLKYVNDDRVSETSYGIDEGKCSLNQFGATVTSKLEWTISNSLSWSSRAYYFTSYHSVQLEFENTFNVKLGHYCTSKLYLYPRFDDSADDKVQMKESLTFGLSFVW